MPGNEDLFTPIHKALRSMLYGLSARLQTHDFTDLAATQALVSDLETDFAVARSAGCALCVMSQHANDEETAIFPATAKHANELVSSLISEHHDLSKREAQITKDAHALLSMGSLEQRIAAGIRLNQATNALLAAYLTHMNREEEELTPLMKRHFTDPEQLGMRGAIMARMPPERLAAVVGWMLPSLNVSELSALLAPLRKAAPPPLVKMVEDLGTAKVDPARWAEARSRAGF